MRYKLEIPPLIIESLSLKINGIDVPMKSEGIFPLLNLPVGEPPMKSLPYGRKLHFTRVVRLLLFPGSTIESPNTINAGIVSFFGSFTRASASVLHKIIKAEIKKTIIFEEYDNTSMETDTISVVSFSPNYKKTR